MLDALAKVSRPSSATRMTGWGLLPGKCSAELPLEAELYWYGGIKKIAIRFSRTVDGSPITIELRTHSEQVILQVCDRGAGIPESERERVFEPFYRLPGSVENGEGSGYGLALVRRIARLHGGDVVCLPREGGGACFETRLPLGD